MKYSLRYIRTKQRIKPRPEWVRYDEICANNSREKRASLLAEDARLSRRPNGFAGALCQLFRYACFREIGGYVPNRAGGIDWIAVTTARMKGWKTRSFQEKRFHHYRSLGTAERGQLAALFSYGEKDYYLGGSPVWQLFRVCYRRAKRPFIIGGLALLPGYCW